MRRIDAAIRRDMRDRLDSRGCRRQMIWQKTGARSDIRSVKKFGTRFAPDKAKPAPVSDRSLILQGRALSRSSIMPLSRTRFRAATLLSMNTA
jgi:hypothetical protein